MNDWLAIDGSHGEGGGQILRSSLALSAISGRPVHLERVRAGRRSPGLAAQHLTAVRAVATLCAARLEGGSLGSQTLRFAPQAPARAGHYTFDVAAAREGGSAGATMLVLQAVLLPLALAKGTSTVVIRGGTHMAWSPPYDYVQDVWLPALRRMRIVVALQLVRSGWFPIGQGEIRAAISGLGETPLQALDLVERGSLQGVEGRALAANLPIHIPQRMSDRACSLLNSAGIAARVTAQCLSAACPGAGIFLTACYENVRVGFNALGQRGKPAEKVAEEAVTALLAHHRSGAALDRHLADQLVLPAAVAAGVSRFTVEHVTGHLTTSALARRAFRAGRGAH